MPITFELPWMRSSSRPHVSMVEDTKRAVADGADTLSGVAQDLGGQAADLSRGAMRIGKDAARKSRDAARKGQLWAAAGSETLRKLQSDAQSTVGDLRSIRVVRQRRQGMDWRPSIALVAGAGAGVAAMYFLDPDRGHRRRVLFRDQLNHYSRLANEWVEREARDLQNRSSGWAIEARKAAEQRRRPTTDYEADDIAATPDISRELAATDWTEPEAPPPSAPETYRS